MSLKYVINPTTGNMDIVNDFQGSFGFTVDGQSLAISPGNYTDVIIPYNCTITNFYLHSIDAATGVDVSGDCIIDILISGVSIIGTGNKPTLSSSSSDAQNVSGWTSVVVTKGDRLTLTVTSAATCTKIICSVFVTKN